MGFSIDTTEKIGDSFSKAKINAVLLHKIAARLLAIILTIQWYQLFVYSMIPEEKFSFEVLRFNGSGALCLSLGLWLSTTKWGARHPIFGLCLLFPSLIRAIAWSSQ